MTRFELLANKSVQDELIEAVEKSAPRIRYTVLPVVHGRGGDDRKLGTAVWPEENFALVCYAEESEAGLFREAIRAVKAAYPTEGIVLFELGGAEPSI